MRIETSLAEKDYSLLKKEAKEILGSEGALYPPFGQLTTDYVEFHIFDTNGKFIEKDKSKNFELDDKNFTLKPGQDLREAGYDRGDYIVRYYFYRPVGGSDDVVLTKTVDGVAGIIHSGDPELTGVPMGEFYIDEQGNAFIGQKAPVDGSEPQPLDIKEFKFYVDEISSSRTEIRVAAQQISNEKYIDSFSKLTQNIVTYLPKKAWSEYVDSYSDLAIAWSSIRNDPSGLIGSYWRPKGATSKSNFGKVHWELAGQFESSRSLPNDGGGEISWTGPNSAQLEFNTRSEGDAGFQNIMQNGKLVVKNAYITGYETKMESVPNPNYVQEPPIPECYIEVFDLKSAGFPMSARYVVKEEASTKTIYGHGFDGYTPIPNLTTPGTRYHFDFGCGHNETTDQPFANHTYDTDGLYTPVVTIITPQYTSVVDTLHAEGDGGLDGPGLKGRLLNGFSPSSAGDTDESVTDDASIDETELPLISALDGKIIGWDGVGRAPFYSSGNSRASAGTRWYVQNGHTRAIASAINTPLRILLGLRKQVLNSNGVPITVNDISNDILLTRSVINTILIGPNLDETNFASADEDELKRNIENWYNGSPTQINRLLREGIVDGQTSGDDDSEDDSEDDSSSDDSDNEETQGSGGVLTLVNSPIATSQGLAGSRIRFVTPTSTNFVPTAEESQVQLTFTANTMVQISGEPIGASGINTWEGWYTDSDFTDLFDSEPNPSFLLTEDLTLYAKVGSGV